MAIYNPNDEVRREQGLRLRLEDVVPAEVEVMNELDPFDDHNRYFRNDEEVLPLLAAEIDATNHGDSTYWRGTTNGGMEEVKKRRKQRLAHLGLIRLIWGAGQAGIVLVAIAQVLRGDPIFPVRWLPGVGPAVESTLDCLIISAIWWLLTVVVRLVRAPAGQGPQGRPSGYVGLGGLIWGTGQVAILLIALAQLLGPLATVLPKVDCLIPSFLQLPWFSNKDVLAIIWAWILYSLAWAVPYTAARMYWQWRDRIGRREAISLIARGYRRPQPGLGAVRPA